MEAITNLWENPLVADMLDEVLAESDQDFAAVASRLPSLFGISEKATFLCFRSLGLNVREVLAIMGLEPDYIEYWRNTDSLFIEWEAKHLRQLQNTLSVDLVKLGFTRNMSMFVAKDAYMIRKSLTDFDTLTKREYDYLMKIRAHYTPNDLLALEKALEPEKHRENTTIILSWGDSIQAIEGVQAPYQLIEGESNEHVNEERILLHDQKTDSVL